MRAPRWLLLFLLLSVPLHDSPGLKELWVFCGVNFAVDENVRLLESLMSRAARAGYTGIVIGDFKFGSLGEMDERYFQNVRRIKMAAAELKLEVMPAIFPIGDSRSLLARDRNFTEALPVRDALFVVRNGAAEIQPEPPVAFRGGDFADLSEWAWRDGTVTADHEAARVTDPQGKNARIMQRIKVKPFRQYHISVRVKTQSLSGTPKVTPLGGEHPLAYTDLGVKGTQNWTTHHVVFNSLDHDEVAVYFTCEHCRTGSLWWSGARIEEVGLLNVVRREGAPLTVKREDGTLLREGEDFDPIVDPRMNSYPKRGGFEVWHETPAIRTKLADGTRLRVSYYHAVTFYHGKAMICPSEPRTVELLRDQAKRLHEAWGAKAYFMQHDEIRVLNWDDSCARRKLDAADILSENVKTCTRILRELDPQVRIYVWSDMFDPTHNAHGDYYLVRGDLSRSWIGLDRNVTIVDWNYRKRDESLQWFARGGQRVLISADWETVSGWLDSARKVGNVTGVMYTTWSGQYRDLERFAEVVRGHP